MAYVYRHIRLDKNEVFYVGVGVGKRWKAKTKRSVYWKNIVNKTAYEAEIFIDDLTFDEARLKEQEFIKLYGRKDLGLGTLVNLTDGGEGSVGLRHTKEALEKISKTSKGRQNFGRHVSEETKRKIGAGNKGKFVSEETRKKMSAAGIGRPTWNKGTKQSAETLKKVSEGVLKHWARRREVGFDRPFRNYIQVLKDGVVVATYEGLTQCCEQTGLLNSSIRRVITGNRKTHRGFTFKYVSKEEYSLISA